MSLDTYIACETCKQYMWVGQRTHLYQGQALIEDMAAFLHRHRTEYDDIHALVFVDELTLVSTGRQAEYEESARGAIAAERGRT